MELLGAAAGTLAGGGIDSIFSKASADQSYEYNRRLQKHDQEWQEKMRATQYQTTVEDMQKAGINPAVALSGGASLSSQGGSSSASAQAPKANPIDVATASVGLKAQKAQIQNQTALTEADVELKKAQATKELKEAGFTDKQIEFYMKHGVFPGATISGGAFGANASVPVGLKYTNKTPKNTAKRKRDFEDMSKYL